MANNAKKKTTTNGGRSKSKPNNGNGGGTQNFRGITQSTARSVTNPFGGNSSLSQITKGLDAFDSCHVPLPRAVGDYTVVRTTQIINYSDLPAGVGQLSLFGPISTTIADGTPIPLKWSSSMGISLPDAGSLSGTTGVFHKFQAMDTSAWNDVRLVPASYSVKVMNPEALQTSTGVVYIGRCRQMLNRSGSTETTVNFANDLVSYSQPELCAAGRLALRGVQVNLVPYDMNALSDFRQMSTVTPTDEGGWTQRLSASAESQFDGLAPVFIYNPSDIKLQLLICCEWRVRFDPSNPAYATHTFHRSSTMEYWEKVQRLASSEGAGVFDLVEKSNPSYLVNRTMSRSPRMI